MPIWRLQTIFQLDTAFPRDAMVITPHFDDHGILSDPGNLCSDLAAAMAGKPGIRATKVTVKAYDAQGTPPVYPVAQASVNDLTIGQTAVPREMCLCLSFFSERNIPSQRGRLYIPADFVVASGAMGKQPSSPQMTSVADFATIFKDLGGVDVDWSVYSRKHDKAYPVSDWWVDNEWDTMRSRGLHSTNRITGQVNE